MSKQALAVALNVSKHKKAQSEPNLKEHSDEPNHIAKAILMAAGGMVDDLDEMFASPAEEHFDEGMDEELPHFATPDDEDTEVESPISKVMKKKK
jgi:hypothetical protein